MEKSNHQLGMTAARTETQKPLPRGTGARPSAGIKFAEMLLALTSTAARFLPPLMWATVLALLLWPMYLKFARRFMDRKPPMTRPKDQTTHPCGGAIMRTDPNTSAINRYQQSWDVSICS